MLSKNTILKAIHNQNHFETLFIELRMLSKNTILKAIHNGGNDNSILLITANAK